MAAARRKCFGGSILGVNEDSFSFIHSFILGELENAVNEQLVHRHVIIFRELRLLVIFRKITDAWPVIC